MAHRTFDHFECLICHLIISNRLHHLEFHHGDQFDRFDLYAVETSSDKGIEFLGKYFIPSDKPLSLKGYNYNKTLKGMTNI